MNGFSQTSDVGRKCRIGSWRAVDVVAMVAGFACYWPLGLSVIGLKIWQRKSGEEGDVIDAARSAFSQSQSWVREKAENLSGQPEHAPFGAKSPWGTWSTGRRPSGNSAFDDWRSAELARLEEERRKILDAEREFSEHMEDLRKARDRQEFEAFMAARHHSKAIVPE